MYIYVLSRKFIVRMERYVEIVIPVEERLEFNIYQAHRGEDFASRRLLRKFSNSVKESCRVRRVDSKLDTN